MRVMGIYLTADNHFGHANVIRYCARPFGSAWHMDQVMIGRWNQVVTGADDVYHLGDFTLGGYDVFSTIVEQLHFRKLYIVPGGHDRRWLKDYPHESSQIEILQPIHYLRHAGAFIVLCHYPMHSWERSHYGSLHLHGHCHGTIGCLSGPRRIDVGVDCHDFYPVHIQTLMNMV